MNRRSRLRWRTKAFVGLGVATAVAAAVIVAPSAAVASQTIGTDKCPDEICGMNRNQVLL